MKLKTAAAIFVVLVLGVFAALSISLIRIVDLLDLEARELAMASESIRVAEELKSRLLIHNRNALLYSLHQDPTRLKSRRAQRVEITNILVTMGELVNSKEEEALLAEVKGKIETYFEERRRLRALHRSPVEQYSLISLDVDEAIAVVEKLIAVNRMQMGDLMEAIDKQNEMADRIAFLLLSLGGVVLLGIIIAIVTFVARPLTDLTRVIARYGDGDSSMRTEIRGLKEIREIGANFNSMADRLEERRQEQLRFIASIAHDLRNPLHSMSLASEVLVAKSREEDRDLAEIVFRQVKNLDRLVGDLLDTSRIEAGCMDLEVSDQDIGSLIRDSVELYRASSDLHGFRVETSDSPLLCRCDGRRISQVINNLISNAVKYSPNGGIVKVKAWEEEGQAIISVADQGIGIASQDLGGIFKPFHRTKATKEIIPGIGLGLSSSRRIVEAHGGQLQVESTPGKGSTFHVILPIH